MHQMQLPQNNNALNRACNSYYEQKDSLNGLLEAKEMEPIKETLLDLFYFLQDIYRESKADEPWRNENADVYNQEITFLYSTWRRSFPGNRECDNFNIPRIIHLNPGPAPHRGGRPRGEEPPPIGRAIAQIEPQGQSAIVGRVFLLAVGIGFWATGIGSLVTAGFKIAGAVAAKEAAKKATEIAVRKAAEKLAIRLAAQATLCVIGGAAGSYIGKEITTSSIRLLTDNRQAERLLLPAALPQAPGGPGG